MKHCTALLLLSFTLSCSSPSAQKQAATAQTETVAQPGKIYYNAFSHNDYWREKPLHDALNLGYNCVEADLHLIDGNLYVAHDRPDSLAITPTFGELYIKPLIERIKANNGKVYTESDRPFYLMVDCKTNGENIYPELKKSIEPYREYFCGIENGVYKDGAILLFLSGSRPMNSLPEEQTRFVFLDGKIEEMGKNIPASLMPVISDNYKAYFEWDGKGTMSPQELEKFRALLKQAHDEGKLFRFWGAPVTDEYINLILSEGIDLVRADDLASFIPFLDKYRK
ncbi:MAG: phosphatidylinositol-specific phospholipase C/glycerophosphodiester phosphodiesterase family protein [Bacteroidales bacterium]